MAKVDCPLKEDAGKVIELGGEMLKHLRLLRIKMRECENCPGYVGCQLLEEWNSAIDQAVTELNEEWGMI